VNNFLFVPRIEQYFLNVVQWEANMAELVVRPLAEPKVNSLKHYHANKYFSPQK
jgi:hypothetical protein